ncbi:MAG: hypothetical protein ACK559_24205, partial [bacterium]
MEGGVPGLGDDRAGIEGLPLDSGAQRAAVHAGQRNAGVVGQGGRHVDAPDGGLHHPGGAGGVGHGAQVEGRVDPGGPVIPGQPGAGCGGLRSG